MKHQSTPIFRLPLDSILPKHPPINHPSREPLHSSSSGFHLSNSFIRNPSEKRSRKGSQTMIIRQVNIQRPRKASQVTLDNDKTGIENKKMNLFPENCPPTANSSNFLPLNEQQVDDFLELNTEFTSRSRVRRKSDTSSWSGGVSALQKRIGFLMFESILPQHQDKVPEQQPVHGPGSSKMRNILKRTLLARDSNRMEGKKDFRRLGSQKDMRSLQKSSSIRDLTQPSIVKNMSKDDGNEGLEVLPETLGHLNRDENGKRGVRSQEQSENQIYVRDKKRKMKKNKTFVSKNQSISNDIKTTKEWILDQYINKSKKGLLLPDKRPTTIFTGNNRRIRFDNDLKKFSKNPRDIFDSVKSATHLSSKSNLFEDMMQALIDSEAPHSAQNPHNYSISEVGDEFDHHLPTIEEEILKNKRRKKTMSHKLSKDDLFKHKTAKSLALISPLASPKPYFAPLLSPGIKDKALKRSAGDIGALPAVRTSSFAFASPHNEQERNLSLKRETKKEVKKLGRTVRPSIAKVKEVQISYKAHSLNALHL